MSKSPPSKTPPFHPAPSGTAEPPTGFERLFDRSGTSSAKWNGYGWERLPMWVADMDFPSPPAVADAIHRRAAHGFFGYTLPPADAELAVRRYLERAHGLAVPGSALCWMPGGLPALTTALLALTRPGDPVLAHTPLYPPIRETIRHWGRELVEVPLAAPGWSLDIAALEARLRPGCKMLILVNPHNPTGRVYTQSELEALVDFCARHGLAIVSDELHCDLTYPGHRHRTISAVAGDRIPTVTLLSPSKTYNLAGLYCTVAVIPEEQLARRVNKAGEGLSNHERRGGGGFIPFINLLSYEALRAAYDECEPWRSELLRVLEANRNRVAETLNALPGIHAGSPEGTYLSWINIAGAKRLAGTDPVAFFAEAGVGLSPGAVFGAPDYLRLNFACPPAMLEEALTRMVRALEG